MTVTEVLNQAVSTEPGLDLAQSIQQMIVQVVWNFFWGQAYWVIPLFVIYQVATWPIMGRGPEDRSRDEWRGFKYEARNQVMQNASHRCEALMFLTLFRCKQAAAEADHIIPWSKGGPTVVSNGQALCRFHNRSKGSKQLPWWHVLRLEKRRKAYFPEGVPVRVHAVMTEQDKAARLAWQAARDARGRGRF